MATCPLGHELKTMSFTNAALKCDLVGCGRPIRRGEGHPRCEECDYDVCNRMHELATPVRQTRSDESCNSASIPAVDQATPPPRTPAQRITELEAENAKLQTQLRSANAAGARRSKSRAASADEEPSPEGGCARSLQQRVRLVCVDWLEPIIKKRPGLRAHIVNYLLLTSSVEERKEFSTLQGASQERYLAIESAVQKMEEQGYSAVHSADLVVNEHLSIGTTRNINDRMTQVKNTEGQMEKIELCRPPSYKPDPEGEDTNMLTRNMNRALGIGTKVIYIPKPFRSDKEIHREIYKTFADRTLHLTVPTEDGYEGAAFEFVDTARDVLRQAEADDNLRALAHDQKRRMQVVFDKLRWSGGKSITRWNARTPDTKRNHNSTRYGRDMLTYQGDDDTKWLTKSVLMLRFESHFRVSLYSPQHNR